MSALTERLRFHGRYATETERECTIRKNAEREEASTALEATERLVEEAQFLLDRLSEYDPTDAEHIRDFFGHVEPAMARLRASIADWRKP